jgi:hypothetical protein
MAKAGRPRKEKPSRSTASVIVNADELLAIKLISKKLGYRSISGLLRSAIVKGILSSCRGELTNKNDVKHWEYLKECFSLLEHFKDLEKSILE